MNIIDGIIQEFQYECGNTRKALARVPEEKFGWKPHEKSMSFGYLATHIAEIPSWAGMIINQDELSFNAGEYVPPLAKSSAELLEMFDTNVAAGIEIMKPVPNERLFLPWTFKMEGQLAFTLPRIAVIRSWILNHIVHHRGQITVYLRLNNVPVPAIYGPSADEAA